MSDTLKFKYGITVEIAHDELAQSPLDPRYGDPVGKITYRKDSHYVLGTEPVDQERIIEISAGIKDGSLIALPVWAYVHSGSTISAGRKLADGTIISANPYHCPWDSGRSGVVYCTREKALEEWGTEADKLAAALAYKNGVEWKLSDESVKQAKAYMFGEVEQFACHLRGEVYVLIVRDRHGKVLDSCGGFIGTEYAAEEAKRMGHEAEKDFECRKRDERTLRAKETRERNFWAARGVLTVPA